MGTPDFAVPALDRLLASRHEVCLVVTQPSKPKGRGRKIADPPIKTLAGGRGIPVLQPVSLKKEPLEDKIKESGIDAIVIVAYGKILPESLLNAPRLGCLNIHASLLPKYRGAAPIQRALMDGQMETGVTIMKVVPQLDAGPIIAQERVEIHDDDDALSLANVLSVVGADLLLRVLDDIEREGVIEGEAQDETEATYAAMISKSDGEIPWKATSHEIMFRLRALSPWPGLFTTLDGKRLRVHQAEPMSEDEAEKIGADDALAPGSVSGFLKEFGFAIRTGDGHLLIRQLQLEGKQATEADAFLHGHPLKIGTKLG